MDIGCMSVRIELRGRRYNVRCGRIFSRVAFCNVFWLGYFLSFVFGCCCIGVSIYFDRGFSRKVKGVFYSFLRFFLVK